MRTFGIPEVEDPKMALGAAITYWVFRCRDWTRSPAKGLKQWEYLQTSIVNASIPSRSLEDYVSNLSKKLVVNHLRPSAWTAVISPSQVIQRIKETGEIYQFDSDQSNNKLAFESFRSIMNSLAIQGITDRHILTTLRKESHLICAYVALRNEEDKAIGQEEIEDIIEVESNEII